MSSTPASTPSSATAGLFVVTTVATAEQARGIARTLVERRLAACVQIERIDSVYRWDDAVCEDAEQRLLCKTTEARAPALIDALRALHPYALPALYTLRPQQLDPAFADWIAAETAAGTGAAA